MQAESISNANRDTDENVMRAWVNESSDRNLSFTIVSFETSATGYDLFHLRDARRRPVVLSYPVSASSSR